MRSSSKEGSYLRLVDLCITRLYAESDTEEEDAVLGATAALAGSVGVEVYGLGFGVEDLV